MKVKCENCGKASKTPTRDQMLREIGRVLLSMNEAQLSGGTTQIMKSDNKKP